MTRKNEIILKLSKKLFAEVDGVAKYIGITREEYLLMLVLRTQPIPVQVAVPVEEPEQFQPDTSMLEPEEQAQIVLDGYKKKNLKFKKEEYSYLG